MFHNISYANGMPGMGERGDGRSAPRAPAPVRHTIIFLSLAARRIDTEFAESGRHATCLSHRAALQPSWNSALTPAFDNDEGAPFCITLLSFPLPNTR